MTDREILAQEAAATCEHGVTNCALCQTGEFPVSHPPTRKERRRTRGTVECPTCKGACSLWVKRQAGHEHAQLCPTCKGRGRVPTEASRRGKRSQRGGRRKERETARWFEKLAAECGHPEWFRDYRSGEAAGSVTGADQGFLCPTLPLCLQIKERLASSMESIPKMWQALTVARDALQPGAVRVLELRYKADERHRRVVHVAVVDKSDALTIYGQDPNWWTFASARPQIRKYWEDVRTHNDGFWLTIPGVGLFGCSAWPDFLADYARIVKGE